MDSESKPPEDDIGHSQTIKAAVHYTVGQIVENIGSQYDLTFSKPLIATITEFIDRQIETYATDLEAFAKHTRRATITCDDVKLLTRRNPKLKKIVNDLSDSLEASRSDQPKRGTKRKIQERRESEADVIDIE